MIAGTEYERQNILVSQLLTLEHGIAFFEQVQEKIKAVDDKPLMINTEDVKSDIRYNIGYMDALKWVVRQPGEAQNILNRTEGVYK